MARRSRSGELDDLTELTGSRRSQSTGAARGGGGRGCGSVSDEEYLRVLWRRVARDTELARPAMGVLADRHWPELR